MADEASGTADLDDTRLEAARAVRRTILGDAYVDAQAE